MLTTERIQGLPSQRYNAPWRRTSAYLPLLPATSDRPRKGWWQRCQRLIWKLTHRR